MKNQIKALALLERHGKECKADGLSFVGNAAAALLQKGGGGSSLPVTAYYGILKHSQTDF